MAMARSLRRVDAGPVGGRDPAEVLVFARGAHDRAPTERNFSDTTERLPSIRQPQSRRVLTVGQIRVKLKRIWRDRRGATANEYGLIAALTAIASISAMRSLGTKLNNTFSNVSNNMKAS